jgi:hypothetical protein
MSASRCEFWHIPGLMGGLRWGLSVVCDWAWLIACSRKAFDLEWMARGRFLATRPGVVRWALGEPRRRLHRDADAAT